MTIPASVHLFPQFQDNYAYLLMCHTTGESAIIDCSDADPLIAWYTKEGKKPSAILNTHHHPDHIAGNDDLLSKWPDLAVLGYEGDRERIPRLTRFLHEGDLVHIGQQTAKVLFVPGHTSGHLAFFFPDAQALFCGDALFAGGCGRLFEGTPAMMHASLQKMAHLPPETQVFCGHEYTLSNLRFALHVEPDNLRTKARYDACKKLRERGEATIPSTISEELHTNPFFRSHAPTIQKAAASQGADPNDPAAVFGAIRKMKDTF